VERVAFLIEETNQRLSCMLNPEGLVMRRLAGVRSRRSATGHLTGAGLADDPLLYTGGGRTELQLDLLFDVALAGSSTTTADVRDLTGPLWKLAENAARSEGYRQLPLARFIWGKSWNVPGLVVAVSERFEQFTPDGLPQRSWLRLRFVRVDEAPPKPASVPAQLTAPESLNELKEKLETLEIPEEDIQIHEVVGSGGEEEERATAERPDQIAYQSTGDPAAWRLITIFNKIDDPLHLVAGALLRIPPLSFLLGGKA
jgi:hypothetical protein